MLSLRHSPRVQNNCSNQNYNIYCSKLHFKSLLTFSLCLYITFSTFLNCFKYTLCVFVSKPVLLSYIWDDRGNWEIVASEQPIRVLHRWYLCHIFCAAENGWKQMMICWILAGLSRLVSHLFQRGLQCKMSHLSTAESGNMARGCGKRSKGDFTSGNVPVASTEPHKVNWIPQ